MATQKTSALLEGIKRVAAEHPDTRKHLVPLIAKYACGCMDEGDDLMLLEEGEPDADDMFAGRAWGKGDTGRGDPGAKVDDNVPYHKHPDSPDAGTDGSAQRAKYNDWFRKNVCPGHKTTCGNPALGKGGPKG
jgi:hypothetical protein